MKNYCNLIYIIRYNTVLSFMSILQSTLNNQYIYVHFVIRFDSIVSWPSICCFNMTPRSSLIVPVKTNQEEQREKVLQEAEQAVLQSGLEIHLQKPKTKPFHDWTIFSCNISPIISHCSKNCWSSSTFFKFQHKDGRQTVLDHNFVRSSGSSMSAARKPVAKPKLRQLWFWTYGERWTTAKMWSCLVLNYTSLGFGPERERERDGVEIFIQLNAIFTSLNLIPETERAPVMMPGRWRNGKKAMVVSCFKPSARARPAMKKGLNKRNPSGGLLYFFSLTYYNIFIWLNNKE